MMIFKFLSLLALALVAQAQSNNCGAPQCYFPCTDARPQVDIVFLIDVSGSMQPIINAVTSGLSNFINSLNNNKINPAFAVALFGDQYYPDARLTFSLSTSTTAFTNYMHTVGTNGGIEPGLEALNQAMNKANAGNLNIAYRNSQNAKKVYILVTNEDSDMATLSANLYGVQNPNNFGYDGYCYNMKTGLPYGYRAISASQWVSWQNEINAVVNNLITLDANIYMFVAGQSSLVSSGGPNFKQTCNTIYQYCNPDIQSQASDYTNFNPTTTYNNLVANSSQTSVQGQMLNKGKTARCFEVQDLKGPNGANLINNFFAQVTADLTKCNTQCYTYQCLTSTTCAPPILKCDCNGVPFTSGGTATLDKNGVCCDAAKHDVNNVCCTGTLDPCGVCTSNGSPSANCKQDCAGTYYLSSTTAPPHKTDECGNCVLSSVTRAATCVQDCAGTWYNNNGQAPHVRDNCNYCVVYTANLDAHKDSCGICDGGDASKNQCNTCGGTKALDACSQPVCKNLNCTMECDGVPRNPATLHIDECGNCIPLAQTRSANCVQDCANSWYNKPNTPPHHVDECGNCVLAAQTRAASCVQDCNGAWAGTAFYDSCHQCVVNNVPPHVCQQDCHGDWYIVGVQTPNRTVDDCGICNLAANRNSLKDHCGICNNSPNYNAAACTQDCKGDWYLVNDPHRAFTDGCNSCWYYYQTNMTNYLMDDCGFCWDSRSNPGWNQQSTGHDSQGVACRCLTLPEPCPGFPNVTTCNDHCPPPACVRNGAIVPYDNCDRCQGDPYYGTGLDDCGVCATTTHVPNSDKDSCGVCFGGDLKKQTNPCHVCDASQCVVDCAGTPNGAAVYDVCGVCAGDNSTCVVCGDGVRAGTEECDLGAQNGQSGSGCTASCKAVAAQNVAAIAGGVVGALVGLVVLGLAAFLALQYAKKNGLIGNANKQLDMASSNSNPLYQGEVKVQHNPLYGQS